jgi:hypothetical protein
MTEHLPAKRALDSLSKPVPDVPAKAARISAKLRQAINLFVSGECTKITEAAERVGLARESLGRALDRPHVIAYLQMRTRRRLELLAARAGAVKGDLLDSPNEMVKDRASSFILGIAGIVPATDPQSARPGDHQQPGIQIVIVHRLEPAEAPAEPGEVFHVRSDLGIITP